MASKVGVVGDGRGGRGGRGGEKRNREEDGMRESWNETRSWSEKVRR